MTRLVLDASVVLAALMGEHNSAHASEIIDQARQDGAVVPSHWHLETGNGLLMAERRGRFDSNERREIMRLLHSLPISVDVETPQRAWTAGFPFAERHRLTLYDAAYLELAVRLGLPLASFDGALRRAAAAENVPLL